MTTIRVISHLLLATAISLFSILKSRFCLLVIFLLCNFFTYQIAYADSTEIKIINELIISGNKNKRANLELGDSCVDEAIKLSIEGNYLKELVDAYNLKGVISKNKKQYEAALMFFNKGIEIAEKQNNYIGIAKAKVNKATSYRYLGKVDSAIMMLESSLLSLRKSEEPSEYLEISILNNLSVHLTNAGDYTRAMNQLLRADSICSQSKDPNVIRVIPNICNGIGTLFADLKNPSEAIVYFKKGLDALSEDNISKYGYYNNIGHALVELGELDTASENYHSVLDSKDAASKSRAIACSGLSKIYTRLKKYEELKAVAKKGLSFADKQSPVYSNLVGNLGSAEYFLGNYKSAKRYLEEGLAEAKEKKLEITGTNIQKQLFLSELRIKKLDKLADDFKSFADDQDTLLQTQVNKDILELESKYTKAQDQQKIAEQNLEIQQQQNANQKKNAGLFGLLLLGGFGGLSAFRFRKKNQEIQLLNRELSHRVKNNLEFISSLLKLQSRELKDAGSKEALTDSENRIQALSSVYKRLYGDDGIVPINLQEYLTELTENLKETYQMYDRDLKIEMDANELLVPAEKATKIGLIVNELVTNSIKYAFQDQDNPVIKVAIRKNNAGLQLHFSDNGSGLENNMKLESSTKSFGMGLVEKLVKQLNGSMQMKNEGGLAYDFSFKGLMYS